MKLAVVGAGAMAKEHLRAFKDAGVDLAGIYSRTNSRAEALAQEFSIGKVCNSISDLYSRTNADLVVVAVPELAANSVIKQCFEHKWVSFLEKPPGHNLADAVDIADCAKANSRRAFVALNRRFIGSTRAVLDDLNKCDLPRFVQVFDQQSLETAAAIGHPAAVVENWMFANSIHLIDYLRVLCRGRITNVNRIYRWSPENPSIVVACVDFDSGDHGIYQGVWSGPGPWAVAATTQNRRWEIRPLEQASFQNAGERKQNVLEAPAWDRDFKPGFRLQAAHAILAVKGEPSLLPSIDDALETMRLISRIFDTTA